jgi:hypothetical protein
MHDRLLPSRDHVGMHAEGDDRTVDSRINDRQKTRRVIVPRVHEPHTHTYTLSVYTHMTQKGSLNSSRYRL